MCHNISHVEILLVEDTKADLNLALRALKKANFVHQIHVARDGAEALDFIFGGRPPGVPLPRLPELILLDLKLPKVDGIEVLRQLKSDPRTRMIPVVVLTSSQEQCDLVDSYQIGANSYIVKPVNFERFAAVVQQLGIYWHSINQPPRSTT